MPIQLVPTYRDLFLGEVPGLDRLLHDISSDLILNLLAFINAQITLGPNSLEHHFNLLKILTKDFINPRSDLTNNLDFFIKKHKGEVRIFGSPYLLDFMQHELQYYREVPGFTDTNPDQSIRILKAYFVFVEIAQEKIRDNIESIKYHPTDKYWFQRRTWPMMIEQYEINNSPNPGIFGVKAFTFFQHFKEHQVFQKYVQGFIENIKLQSSTLYVTSIMDIVSLSFSEPNNKQMHPFNIAKFGSEIQPLLDYLSTNPVIFNSVPNNSKNYIGIRSNPLFNFRGKQYAVLSWHFLYQKLYKGLLFDFYNRSGIRSEFKNFPDYLSILSEQITEYRLFQPVMQHLLAKKHTILKFDNKDEINNANPDLYYRDGNQILLTELKDITLPAEAISNYTFENMTMQLERKLIKNEKGANKGILQILNHIKKINESHFTFDQFERRGIKKRNLNIFPVLIFTNFEYSLPGVEDYLRKRFDEELKTYQSEASTWNIGEVHKLVMIDFDFFLQVLVGGEKINCFDMLRNYNKNLNLRFKKFTKRPSVELSLKLFPGFTFINQDLFRNKNISIEMLFQILGIRI